MKRSGQSTSSTSPLQLFGIAVLQVTSSTRAKWSDEELIVFRNFAAKQINKPSAIADISALLRDLKLDRFTAICNVNKDLLGPIIEVKVRRKLQSVWLDMASTPDLKPFPLNAAPPNSMEKTRLQILRAEAIEKGEDAPTRLPTPPEIYTPDPWPMKSRSRGHGRPPKKASSLNTVAETRKEIARLETALEAARAQLVDLEQAENIASPCKKGRDHISKKKTMPTATDSDVDEYEEEEDPLSYNSKASEPCSTSMTPPASSQPQQASFLRTMSVPKLDPVLKPSRLGVKPSMPTSKDGKKPQKLTAMEKKKKTELQQRSVIESSSDSEEIDSYLDSLSEFLNGKYGKKKTVGKV